MIYTDPVQAAIPFRNAITAAQRILIISHINPDGDAIGSTLAVYHVLRALGKEAIPLAASAIPAYVKQLPGIEALQVYQPGGVLPDADLTFLVDTATPTRIGPIFPEHEATLTARPMVVVDHHVTNDGNLGINLINPEAASACELLYRLFHALDIPISPETATCLLLGHTTDTQSFQVSSTTATSLLVAAKLLERGADQRMIIQQVYYALPASNARLIGQGLSAMQVEHGLVWSIVTQQMLKETEAENGASDELVKQMQRVDGMHALVLFKERHDGTVKVSFRSIPPYNVAVLAQTWGGGGHAQASGATIELPLNQAVNEVLPKLRALIEVVP